MGKRSGIMLAYPFEERRLTDPKFLWRWPVIVQPKLDGERCRAFVEAGKVTLVSSECNEIVSVPHISEQILALSKKSLIPELDGELYKHGWDFSEIHSVVSRKSDETRHERSELMQFHVFDYVSSLQQIARLTQLDKSNYWSDSIKLVPVTIVYDMRELMEAYARYIDADYEGIVIRHISAPYMRKRSRFMMKFKPKKSDYYEIIEVLEAIDKNNNPLNMIGAFRCTGSDNTVFKVGAGNLNHEKRRLMWKYQYNLIGKFCHVQYQNITSGGVPRFGLCIEVIDRDPEEVTGEGIL